MSTKTLRKRIALVAVVALGAGVLATSPANATTPADLAAGDITTTSTTATPGVCSVVTTPSSQSVVVISGYSFVLTTNSGGNGESAAISLSGNLTVSSNSGWDSVSTTTAASTASPYAATSDALTVKAGAVGTGKVVISSTTTSAPLEAISVTIVPSCTNDAYSPSYSYVGAVALAGASNDTAQATNVDVTGSTTVANGEYGYVGLSLKDAYNAALATAGALVATITSGDAYVAVAAEGSSAPAAGKAKTAVLSTIAGKNVVTVSQATADKPTVATVSITFNGEVVGSRTFTFRGVATSIEVKSVTVGKTSSVGYFAAQVKDAAGNLIPSATVANDSTANAAAAISSVASISTSSVSDSYGDAPTTSTGTLGQFTCTALGGTATINVKHVVDAATSVKKSFAIACGGALDTWTMAFDKAVYAPGEIATLTITGKDAKGNLVNSNDTLGTIATSFGGLTAVTAPSSADKFTSAAGVKKYQFAVGTTEGSFVGSFTISGASTDDSAKTVQYKVAGASGVSNADVLKAIVSLIASINKQIAALQKALLKK